MKTIMEQPVSVTLTRKTQSGDPQIIFQANLRELVLFAFLRGFNPGQGEILAKMTGDFRRECMVIVKVNLAGEDFVFELPEATV